MREKLVGLIIGLIIVITVLLILDNIGNRNREFFVKNRINSKIIKIDNVSGKYFRYFYDSKHYFNSYNTTHQEMLLIGDSISKKRSTKSFNIFRKDASGNYILLKTFELQYPFHF